MSITKCHFYIIYKPLAPRWSIGRPQFSSTVLCPKLVDQFGSISGLFAAVLVPLIFSSCFSAYHAFVYLEGSKRVPAWLRCYVVFSACGRSTSTSFFWFGSSSSLPGFLRVGLRYWWCSAILLQGCYVGNDLWRLGFLLRYSSLDPGQTAHDSRW